MAKPTPATWIFQANPREYDIQSSLATEKTEWWNLRQHATKVKVGDRILIWISGKTAGIYAIGEVISAPVERLDSTKGRGYWKTQGGHQMWPRVEVQYTEVMLERPLLKRLLEFDAALTSLSVIKQPRGTNFKVTDDEWEALENWLSH